MSRPGFAGEACLAPTDAKGLGTMFVKLYDRLASLTLGLWLIGGVCLFLAVGSFSGGGAEGSSINDLPLFRWLRETPFALSWWLWAAVALLALLALNTVLCSIESIRMKYRRTGFLILIAPQVMPVQGGGVITCPDGSRVQVANVSATMGPMGFPTDFSAEVRAMAGGREEVWTI